MGLKVAVANGNWSNPATWVSGVLPRVDDVVASNNFTVTIDQNVTVIQLTNTAQPALRSNPVMTSPTTPSGIVTSQPSDNGLDNSAWRAFDGSGATTPSWYASGAYPKWIAYEYVSAIPITQYQLTLRSDVYNPRDWTFEAWDGTSWIILHTVAAYTTGGSYTSPDFNNSTPYIKYRFNVTADRSLGPNLLIILEINLFEFGYNQSAFAGGGFILNDSYTVTANVQGLSNGNAHCLTYNGTTSANLIGTVYTPVNAGNFRSLFISGSGTFNWTGNLDILSTSGTGVTVQITNTGGITNWVGNNNGFNRECRYYVYISGTATLNQTGNVTSTNTGQNITVVSVNAGCTFNLTGTITLGLRGNAGFPGIENFGTTNIIDSVFCSSAHQGGIRNYGAYLTIIGPIVQLAWGSTLYGQAVVSIGAAEINLFSGPFICSEYGFMPYLCLRMHLIPSAASYFEFRDETTGGALAPVPAAPATQLISPSTLVSNLAIADVRFGTVYAMGTLTGTLRMPSANQVTFGVAVDDTFGNSVLTAASVWDYLVSNITVEGSIGMRLKNVATPQTIGEQLEAFLRLD
jgi:hypothetical protein